MVDHFFDQDLVIAFAHDADDGLRFLTAATKKSSLAADLCSASVIADRTFTSSNGWPFL